MAPLRIPVLVLAFGSLMGCSSSPPAALQSTDSGLEEDSCTEPDDFHVQLSEADPSGNNYEIIDATPAVPERAIQSGNTWTVKVTDANGAPVDGATLIVQCSMPKHTHGCGGTGPKVTPLGNGTYKVTVLYFSMPGQWYVYFGIKSSSVSDSAKFPTCIH